MFGFDYYYFMAYNGMPTGRPANPSMPCLEIPYRPGASRSAGHHQRRFGQSVARGKRTPSEFALCKCTSEPIERIKSDGLRTDEGAVPGGQIKFFALRIID